MRGAEAGQCNRGPLGAGALGGRPSKDLLESQRDSVNYLGPSLRRTRKRSRPWLRSLAAILISLLANAAALHFVSVASVVGAARSRGVPEAPQAVELAPLTAREWAANRLPAPATSNPAAPSPVLPSPAAAPPPPPPPPPAKASGQVVDVAPSKNQTPPKESRFLAEHNSTVEKETRSRYRGPGFENPLPKPSEPGATAKAPAEEPRVAAGESGREGVLKQGEGAARPESQTPLAGGPLRAEPASREKLALRLDARGDLRLQNDQKVVQGEGGLLSPGGRVPPSPGEPGEAGPLGIPGRPGPLQLRPSAAAYDRLAGGPAPDKLDGVEEGDGTYLNTREWKYASYFNRISRALRNTWDPSGAMRARDPTGSRYGPRDWLTVLAVRLDDQGALKEVVVQRSSGLDFLDTAAVQAFRRAQPFVNPPRGLADERGEITFTFGFSFEVGRGLASLFGRAPPGNE